jgi:glycosyltransferase involved in cell wall biosynthesis
MRRKALLIIIPDCVSDIVKKGEYTPRYYNPGDLFDEVHLLMTNDDRPDPAAVQKTVGRSILYLHNLPLPSFKRTFGWQPWCLKPWAKSAVALAKSINPSLIRCHGNHLNAYAANQIKQELGIPYVISLHINPDEDGRKRVRNIKEYLSYKAKGKIERVSLQKADLVLPVYQPIIPYLKRMGVKNFKVAYNVINPISLGKKENYGLHYPVRILSVGRQFREKNPENIIRAIIELPNVHLTLVGDGPYHDYLQRFVMQCKIQQRVTFHRAIPNDELCGQLPEYDIFAVHTEYWEISKSVLEPLLTGLPVVINRRIGQPVPELQGDFLLLVENTKEGYFQAFQRFIQDDTFREQLGRRAYAHSQKLWAPKITEQVFVDIYKSLIPGL